MITKNRSFKNCASLVQSSLMTVMIFIPIMLGFISAILMYYMMDMSITFNAIKGVACLYSLIWGILGAMAFVSERYLAFTLNFSKKFCEFFTATA